jgi:GAF domain-containing protein
VRDDKFPSLATPVSSCPGATVTTTISTTYATSERQLLLLGPFHGKPACQQILFGKGVCGTAAEKKESQVVPDVGAFPGHIACDGATKSEIVVPILVHGEVCPSSSVLSLGMSLSKSSTTNRIYLSP